MTYYFSKNFNEFELEKADYYKCICCGFVASKTHYEMDDKTWEKLNYEAHSQYNRSGYDPNNRPPPYIQQALMIKIMNDHGLIKSDKYLDWASGEGKLSILLERYFNISLKNFDKFIKPKINPVDENEIRDKKYSFVINSALFEHVRNMEVLDEINNFVDYDGAFAIHTLVREEIPNDPDWFYLLPVHCSFHTNKSMKILMKNWKYTCSTYCPESKMWVFFKNNSEQVLLDVQSINSLMGYNYLHFKKDFMDYWK